MARWIRLTRGLEAQVDDADYPGLASHRWRAVIGRDGMPYAVRVTRRANAGDRARSSSRQMQRVILDPRHLRPRGATITHRNGDTLDNRRDNLCWTLRLGDRAAKRLPKTSQTGFLGVQRFAADAYRVQLQVGGRRWSGGTHLEPISAARAYNALALRHIGPGATLNKVPDPLFDLTIYEGTQRKRRSRRLLAHPGTQDPSPACGTSAEAGQLDPGAPEGNSLHV